MRYFYLGFLILILLFSGMLSAGDYQLVRVHIKSLQDVETLAKLGIDFEGSRYKEGHFMDVQVSLEEKARIENAGFFTEVLIDDLEQFYASRLETRQGEGFGYGSMGGFYTFTEVLAQLDSMINQYPNLISKKDTIGYSMMGKPIVAVKISDNPNLQENEPEVLFTALHHAREPQSMMTILYYMWYLMENYGSDPQATFLVDNRQMWFIPVVNPDGYVHNQQTNPGGGGMWRKNGRDNNDNGQHFDPYDGVDLNRNYGYMWAFNNSGSSPDPGSNTYRGPYAFSESETAALRDFCNQHQFADAFNYHTYSNLLIHPWAYSNNPTPDHNLFYTFGMDMTRFNGYTLGTPIQTVGYDVNGDSNDWMYGEQTTKPKIFAYTPEVGSFSDGFWPSTNRIIPLAQENLYSNLVLSYIAGAYPKIYQKNILAYGQNNFVDPGEMVEVTPAVTNFGLQPANPVTVQLIPLTAQVEMINSTVSFPAMNILDSLVATQSWQFKVKYNTPVGSQLPFEIQVLDNGTLLNIDSLLISVGTPTIAFEDDGENGLSQWSTFGGWGLTTSSYHSPSHSFTDSPTGNYPNNANMWLRSPAIDLTNMSDATLNYWTKWDIETDWDFGLVEISTNGGISWTPLVGQYMQPGSGQGVQTTGLYGYEGTQLNWVRESISLSAYAGQTIHLRFRLISDSWVTEDGWYVDDISVNSLDPNANIPPYIQSVTELNTQPFTGNPYPVTAVILDDGGVEHASLFYSTDGGSSFTEVAMSGSGQQFTGEIPALSPGLSVPYYVQAWDSAGFYSLYPYNAPAQTLQLNIVDSGPAIAVHPTQLDYMVPQFLWQTLPLVISNPGTQTLTYQITDANVTTVANTGSSINPYRNSVRFYRQRTEQLIRTAMEKSAVAPAPYGGQNSLSSDGERTIVITDSTGDTNLPAIDIVSVDFSENFLNYSIKIDFMAPPDTSAMGIVSFDVDQNFGTGTYPAPFGLGLGNFDIGAEYEVYFDFSNMLGDTLGLPPSAFVINTADTSFVGLPIPIQFSGNSAKVDLIKILFPIFDNDMNIAATMLPLRGQAIPDAAPNFGHGRLGSELGCSWVTETDTAQVASYPYSGSLNAGDSTIVLVKVAAAYPMDTYQAKLIIDNNSTTTPVEVPVTMQILAPGQAGIIVTPPAISDSLPANSGVHTINLEITNGGSSILLFTIVDSLYNGTDWLSIDMPFGAVPMGQSKIVPVDIDTDGLTVNTLYQAQLKILSNDPNNPEVIVPVDIYIQPASGIASQSEVPHTLQLYANYPNPFNPGTLIAFDLPHASEVSLDIFNILGQKVATLVEGKLPAGSYRYYWNARNQRAESLSSGIYIYRLKADDRVLVRKMLFAK